MSHQPAKKGNQLLGEAIDYYWSIENGDRNDLTYQRLRNSITRLLRSVPGDPEALIARGVLETAVDDIRAIDTIENAVARVPHEPEARMNLITALMHFGFLDRALSQTRYAYDLSKGSSDLLSRLIRYSVMSGYIDDAKALIGQWRSLFPDRQVPEPSEEQIDWIDEAMADHTDSDPNAIGDAIAIATQVARDHRYAPRISSFEIHCDESSHWLSVSIAIKADIDTLIDLEIELADRLAHTDLPERLGSMLVIEFEDSRNANAEVAA